MRISKNEIDSYVKERDGIKRVDPEGCGCTDCMIGHSRPFDETTDEQLIDLIRGNLQDATGYDAVVIADEARERGLVEDDDADEDSDSWS